MLKPLRSWAMRNQQLRAGERASLVQSFSPGTTCQLSGMVLGTMNIPFHRAGNGKDTLHSGCEAETDSEKDLWLLLSKAWGNVLLPIAGEGNSSTLSFILVVPVKKQEMLTTSGLCVHLYFQTTAQTRSLQWCWWVWRGNKVNSITDKDQTNQSHPDNKDKKPTWGKGRQSSLLHFFFFGTSVALSRRLQEDTGKIRGMENKLTSAVFCLAQMGGCEIKSTQETAAKSAEAFLGDLQSTQLIAQNC